MSSRVPIGKRLREVRTQMNMTQKQFCLFFGPTVSSISSLSGYETGDADLPRNLLLVLSRKGVNLNWLFTGEGNMYISEEHAWHASGKEGEFHPKAAASVEAPPEDFIMVPLYDVQASAGGGSVVDPEHAQTKMSFSKRVLEELGVPAGALACLYASGDSMEPTIHPGDLLLIDLSAQVRTDAIYVIQSNDSLVVKRVQKMFDGSLIIKSDNPVYREQMIDKGLLETVRIVGRVVWAGRRL